MEVKKWLYLVLVYLFLHSVGAFYNPPPSYSFLSFFTAWLPDRVEITLNWSELDGNTLKCCSAGLVLGQRKPRNNKNGYPEKKNELRNSQSLFVTLQQADPAIKSSFKPQVSSQENEKKGKRKTFRLNEDVSVKLSMAEQRTPDSKHL